MTPPAEHTLLWITGAIALVILVYAVMLYNSLVTVKNNVSRAWANIDVLLKQRHDELPNLVEICRHYSQFERETLVRVTEARKRVAQARKARDIPALGPAEGALRAGIARVFALAEGYPELRANENFLQLQRRISGLENAIADRREFYNESVNVNNTRIEHFPEVLMARLFRFRPASHLEFEASESARVSVGGLLASRT